MSGERVAIVADYLEERWASMDLVASMLLRELKAQHRRSVVASLLRPRFVRRFSRARAGGEKKYLFSADRMLNRFIDYPRFLRARRNDFDLFHIVDHSYSHLVPVAGPERSIVACHDLDTFRCIIEPHNEPRSRQFRHMTRRILNGFVSAMAVTCTTAIMRDQILRHRLIPAERLTVSPYGVADSFNPRPDTQADSEVLRLLGPPDSDRIELLHVGTTIPRKRIDVLLRVFAALRREIPSVRLIRVGGAFTPAHLGLMRDLALPNDSVIAVPFVGHETLPAVYRRATLTVLPSDAEGFGIPVAESMACGTPVVVSDFPVLREIAGPAAAFCTVGDVEHWTGAILNLLQERLECPNSWKKRKAAGTSWARQFTWTSYAERAVAMYRKIGLGLREFGTART